jgi:CRP-like cAMP-binding protein
MDDVVTGSRLFAGFAASDVQAIIERAALRRFEPNTVLTHQGAPANELILITEGRARYFANGPDGQKMLLLWLTPGEIIGAGALYPEALTYKVSAETVQATSGLVWSRSTIRSLVSRYPRLTENALSYTSDYLDWYLCAYTALRCQSAHQRLAAVLLSLAPLLGHPVEGGVEFDVTNDELASAAHVTPFTVSRLLNQWQRHKAVVKRRGKIVLLAPQLLYPPAT